MTPRETVRLNLAYRAPFDWGALLGYLAARATPGIEAVDARGRYWRSIHLHGHAGYIAAGPAAVGQILEVELSDALLPVLVSLQARLRRLFDLDADPGAVAAHLGGDSVLGPMVVRRPGLRVPGAVDGFELALRAVLGQQVTVRGATTLAGRLARLLAEPLPGAPPAIARLPISAERLAGARLAFIAGIGLPRARAECILALARAVAGGELPELSSDGPAPEPASFRQRLRALPGVGAWTAEYVVMRSLHWPDAFPDGDVGLRKAMGGLSPARLRAAAEAWRPWRAYAAQHLWASLGGPPSRPDAAARNGTFAVRVGPRGLDIGEGGNRLDTHEGYVPKRSRSRAVKQLTLNISGMTCDHCVGAVTRALQQLEGVQIRNVAIGSASVAYDPDRISPDRLSRAIEDAGYQVQEGSTP